MMVEGAVSGKSVKQTLTTFSTMEAEYVVCYEAICLAIWLWNLISALGVVHSISRPLKLLYDNSIVVSLSKNTRRTSCSKHIDVKFKFFKDSLISIEHTPMTSMLTDPLAKDLPICLFQEHVTHMGLSKS